MEVFIQVLHKIFRGLFYLAIFFLALIGSFGPLFSFLHIFYEFGLVSTKLLFGIPLIVSGIFTITCLIVAAIVIKSEKKTKIGQWISVNIAKLILAYILLVLFLCSINSELVMTIDDMKEVLSLGWSIMGISVTVFLIWHVLIMEYLEKRKPSKPQNAMPLQIFFYLQEKESFYSSATMLFSNAQLLLFNLIGLCIATHIIYIISNTANLFNQSVATFTLFLCTNTIIGLLMDIMKLFNEKKKEMLKGTKTTHADVELQNKIMEATENMYIALETIDKLQTIEPEEKEKLKSEIIRNHLCEYSENSNTGDNL